MSEVNDAKHKWAFRSRFHRNAFGWKSPPAEKRIREAVSEICKVGRKEPLVAAEGAVIFFQKLAPAIEGVDSSSGALGGAVNKAIDKLVPLIANARVDAKLRTKWLDRLWQAIQDDQIPYLEYLPEFWGDLCADPVRAAKYADQFMDVAQQYLSPLVRDCYEYKTTAACFSSLFAAGRYDAILALSGKSPSHWSIQKWGVKALLAKGDKAKALRFAQDSQGLNQNPLQIAKVCEDILLSCGLAEEAYKKYAIEANQRTTYLATFRAMHKKYAHKDAADILQDLVETTPGNEGKWFAAAKSAGLYDMAIQLANKTPCDPRTLTRAARDFAEKEPAFACEAGLAALHWLVEGYGYEITNLDVLDAWEFTLAAAGKNGTKDQTIGRIRAMVAAETWGDRFVNKVLGNKIGILE